MDSDQHQTSSFAQAASGSEVGSLLRSAREQGRYDLDVIADTLHIRSRYLLAIEEGRFRDLPGPTYALGFVRSYAGHLGLDAPEVIRRFKEETANLARRPDLVFPAGAVEKTVPTGMLVAIAVVLAAVVYGVWYFLHARNGGTAALIQQPPAIAETAPPAAAPGSPAATGGGGSVIGSAQATQSSGTASSSTTSASPQTPGAPPSSASAAAASGGTQSGLNQAAAPGGAGAPTAVAVAPLPPQPDAAPVYSGPRLMLRATATTWVRVRDSNGAMIYSETMHKNDQYAVPDKLGLHLRVGNAKAVTLLLDGKPLPETVMNATEKQGLGLALDPSQLAQPATPPG